MADETSSPSSESSGKSQVDELVERGLKRYAAGQLRDAMSDWEAALAIDPESSRAREYLDYVCDNFDLLAAHFEAASEAGAVAAELDVPFGLESVGEDDEDDAYDLVVVDRGEPTPAEPSPAEPSPAEPSPAEAHTAAVEQYIESVDEGWFLDDEPAEPATPAAALPPPPEAVAAEAAGVGFLDPDVAADGFMSEPAQPGVDQPGEPAEEPAPSEPEGGAVFEMEADLPPEGAPEFDLSTGPAFDRPEPDRSSFEVPDSAFDLARGLAVEQGDPAVGPEPVLDEPTGSGDYDDEMTVERRGHHVAVPAAPPAELEEEEVTVPGGDEPLPFTEKLNLSQDALAAIRPRGAVSTHTEEETQERPGIVKRGFALRNLDDLDAGMRRDDRVLEEEEEEGPEVRVTFRGAGSERGEPDPDEEMTTERHAGDGLRAPAVLEEELTVERRSDLAPARSPAVIIDESLLGDELETVDRRLGPGGEVAAEVSSEGEFSAGQETKKLDRRTVGLSDDLEVNQIADAVLQSVDAEAVGEETGDERTRRRVTRLIEEAARHSGDGRHAAAVAVLELALSEDPDSAAAQMVVHRHRDLLLEIYQQYVGDMRVVPSLTAPPEALSNTELDSRSMFLLSRLDGTLSFEEILDVSGMPRIEAFRYLCRMLLRGVLAVR